MATAAKQTISAEVPRTLVRKVDAIAAEEDRSKSYIIREALDSFIHNHERRREAILRGLADVDAGNTFSIEEMTSFVNQLKASVK
ncbi:CopG family ribbon-helix-helix protein [Enterobacter hormaechei]|uniref:CopG family ribbon-helix-helix protein n=1 Tax=Enterobacter hormaechei TaxID=158836 RepID=UPI0022364AF3|nr:ribbon-helix-helix protein, CopG family [Enterobacter hormaechei]MCW4831853.1 ribbon-helix-helix protein, CopG family [Enterobacter hormaechei subsp. xiangfangensis]